MPRVLYVSQANEDVYDIIREQAPEGFELITLEKDSEEERQRKAADCEVIIVAASPLRRPVIEAAGRLRLVHHQGVGYHDTVDYAALAARGIPLALTPEGTTTGVAEHAVLLALAVCKRLPYADAELRRGQWHINSLRPESREICGMTVGYLGMGRIGQAVAERLSVFGTKGIYCDETAPLAAGRERELGLQRVGFGELLTQADLLTLHLPLTTATRNVIDKAAMAALSMTKARSSSIPRAAA